MVQRDVVYRNNRIVRFVYARLIIIL